MKQHDGFWIAMASLSVFIAGLAVVLTFAWFMVEVF